MLNHALCGLDELELLDTQENHLTIKRIYNDLNELSAIHILNSDGIITKCLFYRNENKLSNMSVYNPQTGKEIKNISYREDGKTISSIREYDAESSKLLCVIFYELDGKSISSIIEYNNRESESKFIIFDGNGNQTIGTL